MEKLDIFLWAMMGMMLAVFMPVGLIMLAYLIIRTLHQMFSPEGIKPKYKEKELSPEELEKAK